VGDDLRKLLRWLQSQHAPLGHAAPFAASALFAVARFMSSTPLRILAYSLATGFAILIAIDIATELLEPDDAERRRRAGRPHFPVHVPLTPFQFVLAGVQAAIYTILIFVGLGPATPFIFLVPVFAFSTIAAWRNVRLWYRQGMDYEARLHDLEAEEAIHRANATIATIATIRTRRPDPTLSAVIACAGKRSGPKVPQD
jgi:hypothetical protein